MADSNPFENFNIDDEACFLCGSKNGDVTEEHVFPQWLQRKHKLWSQLLHLTNETRIRYRQITIPCCSKCNNEDLSQLETKVAEAINAGYEACKELDEFYIFQWVAKIYYGILRKEITLCQDRANKNNGETVLPGHFMEDLRMLHVLLQSIRRPLRIENGKPYTVMVVNLHESDYEGGDYWYRDNFAHLVLAIRSGTVGIIVALEDGGINEYSTKRYVQDVAGRKLNEIQFEELYIKTVYKSSLLNRTLKYTISAHTDESKPIHVMMMNLAGFNYEPVMKEWNQEEFAHVLHLSMKDRMERMGLKFEDIFLPPDRVMTWMTDEEGNPLILDKHGQPES